MQLSTLRRPLAVALVTASLSAINAAQADGVGFMVGGGAYYTLLDDELRSDLEDLDQLQAFFDDSSYGFNGTVGWRFNKWLAVEAGYWDLGEFKSDPLQTGNRARIETTTYNVGGMVSVPLWILDVYARGGAAFWEAESRNFDDDGTDPYYGLGASLNIGGSLDLYLEWVRFDLGVDLDTVGLGVRFTF